MNRFTTFVLSAATITSLSTQAAIITFTSTDVGSDLTKFTFTASNELSDPGLIGGMNLTFTAIEMNQINPFALATVFQDSNSAIVGTDGLVDQDSQFLFNSSDLTISAGTPSESTTYLTGAFVIPATESNESPFNSRDIAQIVVPTGTHVYWQGYISFANTNGLKDSVSGSTEIPEPSSLALLGLGGLLIARRRR